MCIPLTAQAARRLAEQHRADRASLGEVPTLFAFFFTGHGLAPDTTMGAARDARYYGQPWERRLICPWCFYCSSMKTGTSPRATLATPPVTAAVVWVKKLG